MRTVKWNACLSGLCGLAVALGMMTTSARADVTTERGASILAFPKVLAADGADTVIQITNISNSMVHARCFYVNAQLRDPEQPEGALNQPLWQETDFTVWLTKQQPTHWQVSAGRVVNPSDNCFASNGIDQGLNSHPQGAGCDGAGLDPGAVPPVPEDFIGELKCVEVDSAGNPIGGNHLKGEATIKRADGDVSKYNAVGLEGTELAGATGNTLLLNQPAGSDDPVGQYTACPATLILNHFADGATNPTVLENLRGGTCSNDSSAACQSDDDCDGGVCNNGPQILSGGELALRSATVTDLTLVPCQQDLENQIPGRVTVQFLITNEFENKFSASTTVTCWKNFFLFQVDSPNNPERSVFSYSTLGTTVAQTRLTPVEGDGAVIGVTGVTTADNGSRLARAALNIHIEGDRFSATDGEVIDEVILPEQ